jgi:2-methylcitrate dehydratase PrpD
MKLSAPIVEIGGSKKFWMSCEGSALGNENCPDIKHFRLRGLEGRGLSEPRVAATLQLCAGGRNDEGGPHTSPKQRGDLMDTEQARDVRPESASQTLAAFVATSSWADIEPGLRHEAKRSLLNFFGCALGVARTGPIETAVRVLRQFSGPAQASLIGRHERLDILSASFVNAVSANLLDYDDTHLNTVIHPTAPVAPAVLALAEERGYSGAAVLQAFILGAEVECRIGNGVSPGHYARGWHITATCGVFGAAAASAKLLGLPAAQIANALGIAASQSAGLVENLPTAAKNVGVGNAARNGLFAALMAQGGYEAASTSIEGPLGWASASGDAPNVSAMVDGLGDRWEFLKNTYKPYPSGIVFHAIIDACLALRRDLDPGSIDSVTVSGDALLLARGDRVVRNERDARVSIHHTAAVALLFGAAGVREYAAEMVDDDRVRAFRSRVRVELAPDLPRGAARVDVKLQNGRMVNATIMHARGSAEHPLGDKEIEEKVRDLARQSAPTCDIDGIIDAVWRLDEAADVRSLMARVRSSDR